LLDKIEKAKDIVQAGKTISALKEDNERLRAELKKASVEHLKEMHAVEDAANTEIESLKQTIAEQADLLRTQERKAEEDQKAHEEATVALQEELERLTKETGRIDVELRSKYTRLLLFCLACVKRIV
jgi:hypothetical protein